MIDSNVFNLFRIIFDLDITPRRYVPKPEILSFESAIGDARFEGDNVQAAPAWKLVTCQGEMSNIQRKLKVPDLKKTSFKTLQTSPRWSLQPSR